MELLTGYCGHRRTLGTVARWVLLLELLLSRWSRLRTVVVLGLCSVGGAVGLTAPASAQFGQSGTLTTRNTNGGPLLVDYYYHRPSSHAVAMLHVTVNASNGPSPRDRQLELVLRVSSLYAVSDLRTAIHVPVLLPEGQASTTVMIPHGFCGLSNNGGGGLWANENWELQVREEGVDIRTGVKRAQPTQNPLYPYMVTLMSPRQPALLVLTPDGAPLTVDSSLMAAVDGMNLRDPPQSSGSDVAGQKRIAVTGFGMATGKDDVYTVLPLSEAPRRWLEYLAYDLVVTDTASLAKLIDEQAAAAAALRTYVAAGGSVLLRDPDSALAQALLDRLLQTPAVALGGDVSSSADRGAAGTGSTWSGLEPLPMLPRNLNPNAQGLSAAELQAAQERAEAEAAQEAQEAQAAQAASVQPPIQYQRFLLGRVGVGERDAGLERSLSALNSKVVPALSHINDRVLGFRNLIRSVGRAPVWAMCALMLVFGCLLGPGLLLFTGRIGRRSLMILLVPVCSFVATLALVLYSVLGEGFGTSVRITSVVAVDEVSRTGIAWSRQTYFSGWPPRDGLTFDSETYFRPVSALEENHVPSGGEPLDVRNHIYVGQEQVRWKGWLRAREQQQALVGHPVEGVAPIQVERGERGMLRVTNRDSSPLKIIAIRDPQGDYYQWRELGIGKSVDLVPENQAAFSVLARQVLADYTPSVPVELQGYRASSSWRFYSNVPVGGDDPLDSTWRLAWNEMLGMPSGCFVAFRESADGIRVPLSGSLVECRQVVLGRLAW
jgi:hypothetical protein